MIRAESDESLVPFPGAGARTAAAPERWLRPFGLYEADLHVDLRAALRPIAVTKVLGSCLRGGHDPAADEELLWDLPVGVRIQALMTLAVAWDGGEIELALRCPEAVCGEELEMEVTLDELAEIQREAYGMQGIEVEMAGSRRALRRPTGRDQLAWLRGRYLNEEEATMGMIRLLAGMNADADPALDGRGIAAIDEAMGELDPLVNFIATVRCAGCGCEHTHGIDLEEIALRRLRGVQLRLLSTVHRLAWHYHWSEQQTFAVPQWRREHYLALIEREKG